MKHTTDDDHFDWFGALQASAAEVKALLPEPKPTPAPCLCGSTDIRGRIIATPVTVPADAELACDPNEGQRPCRACGHGIAHHAMCVKRFYGETTTVRDHYHPECVRLS